MKLLLDTHALIWWWKNDARLSSVAKNAISDDSNDILVSAASIWEIATKHRLGKLPEAEGVLAELGEAMLADGFKHLAVDWRHSLLAGQYPHHHADPFDRILAAQSQLEQAVLVSKDAAFSAFTVQTLW